VLHNSLVILQVLLYKLGCKISLICITHKTRLWQRIHKVALKHFSGLLSIKQTSLLSLLSSAIKQVGPLSQTIRATKI